MHNYISKKLFEKHNNKMIVIYNVDEEGMTSRYVATPR